MQSQEAVLAYLASPSTHGTREVERIDTHISTVFLAGDRALKVKRAVRYPFLDYSTLAKRKAACAAELAVNRRFAPQIYYGIVPITREPDGRLAIAGKGRPVEWAVDMRRFDEERTLDRLADAGEIDAALADALGREIAAAHREAPIIDAAPWIEALSSYLDRNATAFRAMPDLFAAAEIDALDRLSRASLARIRPLLIERGRLGLIRRGHGDLHLGNIALIDGKPVAFDAIEFDPVIASGDVLYDLAFLLMDLIERGLRAAANIVLNRYLIETQRVHDLDALCALPLFLSLRAAIRANVTAARMAAADAGGRPPSAQAAQAYFALARGLIVTAPPVLVAVGGLSGTGKSVLARALAPELEPPPGAVVLRSDVERKALFAISETEKLPPAAYDRKVTAKVYGLLADKARRVIEAGHSAIVDAVYAEERERAAIRTVAAEAGSRFRGIYLVADLATRLARVGSRARDASDADQAVARRQEDHDLGRLDWTRIDASGTPAAMVARAKAALA
jgi:aminoglycoside phosphotransferase family enzyme/predicted kinase